MSSSASRPRCNLPTCNRYAVAGHLACRAHLHTDPDELNRAISWHETAASYKDMLGPSLSRLMADAASQAGLDDEIGALRLTMARVLQEETDPIRLAQAVSRLTAASIAAAKAKSLLSGAAADTLTDAITQILLDLDAPK